MSWTIKRAAEITGIPADTLRYYEKERIVTPKRHENGYRYYDETDIIVLKYLVAMKYANFSLAEIKSMVKMLGHEPGAECNEFFRDLLNTKVSELKHAIRNYQKIVRLLEKLLPMIGSVASYQSNQTQVVEFIYQIFDDIQTKKEIR